MSFMDYLQYASPAYDLYRLGGGNKNLTGSDSLLSNGLNTLQGNPQGVADQISQLEKTAFGQGNAIKNFLLGEQQNSEKYYKPMQAMFGSMYGSGGLTPAKAPTAPGGGTY